MSDVISAIRQEASRLLAEDVVDVVIGFKASALPLRAQPAFITREQDVDQLVLDGFCQNNLAAYLTRRPRGERHSLDDPHHAREPSGRTSQAVCYGRAG